MSQQFNQWANGDGSETWPFWPRLLGFGSPHRHSWPRVFWTTLVKIGKRMAEICWDHWLYNMINEHHMISTDIICLEGVIEWLSEQTWKSRGDMSHWNVISIQHLNDDVAFKFRVLFRIYVHACCVTSWRWRISYRSAIYGTICLVSTMELFIQSWQIT